MHSRSGQFPVTPNESQPMAVTQSIAREESEQISGYLGHMAKGAMINFSGAMVRTVLTYAYALLLAHLLPVDKFGDYFLIYVIITILGVIGAVGLDFGVVRYVALYVGECDYRSARKSFRIGFTISVAVGVLIGVAVFLLASSLSDLFLDGSRGAATGLRVFAVAIPMLVAARLGNAATQAMHRMAYQVYSRDMGEQSMRLIFSIIAIAIGTGFIGVVTANVVAIGVAMIMSLGFALLVLPKATAGATTPVKPSSDMLRYSFPLAFSTMLGVVLLWADMLMVGYLGTSTEAGFYGAAIRIGTASAAILLAFSTVFTPIISDLYNRNMAKELESLYKAVSRWVFICSMPIFLVEILFSEPIMRIFGSGFVAGSDALMILAVGQLINTSTGPAGVAVLMSGRSKLELMNVTIVLALDVVLCFIFIPAYGVMGAAVANAVCAAIINIMRVVEVRIIMKMYPFDLNYLKPALAGSAAAVLTGLASHLTSGNGSTARVVILIFGLLLIYVAGILVMGLDERDRTVLRLIKEKLIRTTALTPAHEED